MSRTLIITFVCEYWPELEENLHKKLASDQFDVIAEAITPKTLGDCSANTLLKAFEVRISFVSFGLFKVLKVMGNN